MMNEAGPDEVRDHSHEQELRKVVDCVWRHLLSDDRDPARALFNIHQNIAIDKVCALNWRKPCIDLFLNHGQVLLSNAERLRMLTKNDSVFAVPEMSDEGLEALAGDWLALYFLGVPHVELWETVAFFAEGSGFPRGASLCKAVGDVYRRARKSWLQHADSKAFAEARVFVVDHNPLAIWGKDRQMRGASVEDLFNLLGAMYELLQLRLYVEAGGPILYLVPEESLRVAFRTDAGELDSQALFLWNLLAKGFPQRFADRQAVHIVRDENVQGMPECVVGPLHGVFRIRTTQPGSNGKGGYTPERAGNFMASRICTEFREKLGAARIDDNPTLQAVNDETPPGKIAQYLPGRRAPSMVSIPAGGSG